MDDHLRAGAPSLAPLAPKYPEDVTTGWLAVAVAGPAGVLSVPGYPEGDGIAHWQYKSGADPTAFHPFQAVCFGNRGQFAPQMPPSVRRLEAGRSMASFLQTAPFSEL